MTTRTDITNWLGDSATTATDEQIDTLVAASTTIDARWPDPDDADSRAAALEAAAWVVFGDDTLEGVAEAWRAARKAERERMAALTGALIASPGTERDLVERSGVARMTVRKALGR